MTQRALLPLLLILWSTVASADCLTPQWATSESYFPGNYLWDRFVTADFDEDGKPDVVALGSTTAPVVVFLRGKGDGLFEAPVTLHSAGDLEDVLTRDVNGDGNLDLIVVEDTVDQFACLIGHGDGTFAPAVTSSVGPLDNGERFTAGDLTGDGKTDVVSFTYSAGSAPRLNVYPGDGNGSFGAGLLTPVEPFPSAVASGDLDGDGATDVVVAYAGTRVDVLFGNADGTFDPAVQTTGGTDGRGITLSDVDGDGDADVVIANMTGGTVTVQKNLGGRAFAPAVAYDVTRADLRQPSAKSVAVADLTGDGIVDLAVSAGSGGYLAILRGNGGGTFATASFYKPPSYGEKLSIGRVAAADFDLDGRIDLAVPRLNFADIPAVLNRCGDIRVTLTTETPTITAGQSATFRVTAMTVFEPDSEPTGTVSIVEGDHVWATGSLANSSASFTVAGLPLGDRTLTATYSGNAEYEPARSSDFVEHVTSESTTTTITLSPDGDPEYGDESELIARVTSSTGTPPTGRMMFGIDAPPVPVTYAGSGPEIRRFTDDLSAGSHLIYASFLGDETHPPSDAIPLKVVIRKSTTTVTLHPHTTADTGVTSIVATVDSTQWRGSAATGVVKFFDRNVLLGTAPALSNGFQTATATLTMTLPPGRHDLRASYPGDANHNAAESSPVVHSVFAAGELAMDARGNADGIEMAWAYRPSDSGVYVFRAPALTANWTYLSGYLTNSPKLDTTASAGSVYLYRLQLHADNDLTTPTQVGTVDLGVRMTFSNDPALPVTSPVRLSDVQELVNQTNFLRSKAGLAAVTFTDLGAGKPMRLAHITTLRTKINEARVTLGAAPVTFARSLSAGARILAADVQELREAAH
jgi:hypothetical protein